ncbi:MAG: 3D domain-containing protein, partial [Chloroflexota bacterium]|nr:3D domain-containing protein [Chloroflexota bacterium]
MRYVHQVVRILLGSLVLILGPVLSAPTQLALAESAVEPTAWYRYQGEPSSYDSMDNQQVNCGPTSVAMAIQYARGLSVPIRDVRAFIGKHQEYTYHSDITRALDEWDVEHRGGILDAGSLREVVSRGNAAIVALDMGKVSRGRDADGASTDPTLRTGRFETRARQHWIIIKGVSADGRYFVVYDGNVWGGPGNATYWYSDGTPKGLDRLYLASEVEAGMSTFGTSVSKGVEIVSTRRPAVEVGQDRQATVTYYTASFEETGKRPGDPGHGVMFNGNKVHWGAVAVDPEVIPLGTRMRIEGWGDQVFTAEDTGSAVRGWHVDVYWPGTRQEAFEMNDRKGGTRTITLLEAGPVFADAAPSEGPTTSSITLHGGEVATSRFVTLSLSASDAAAPVTGMMLSNSPHFAGAFEEPYATTREWTLPPGDGTKTLHARFKNDLGAWSEAVSVEVDLQERPPQGTVVIEPDPRLITAAALVTGSVPGVGPYITTYQQPPLRPLGHNLLLNSSFEAWAGGIPESWDTGLEAEGHAAYEARPDAYHGALALGSESARRGSELTQTVPIRANTTYTLTARLLGAGGRLMIEELVSLGAESRVLASHVASPESGNGWTLLRSTFTSSSAVTDARVILSGERVGWDAMQLQEGGEVQSYTGDGALLEPPTTNYLHNPSVEVRVGEWGGLNSWVELVPSAEYARYGSKALKIRKTKPGRAATFHPAELVPGKR